MRLHLSSQIVLNKVPVEFYKPQTTVEYSEISRMEKLHTDIFASMAEGASHVAAQIQAGIQAAQPEGKCYAMAPGSGSSLHPGDFRVFYSRLWLVELYTYFIEYDLRTKIESHIFIYIYSSFARSEVKGVKGVIAPYGR